MTFGLRVLRCAAIAAFIPHTAAAHVVEASHSTLGLRLDFWLCLSLSMGLLVYLLGLRRLWRGKVGRGVSHLRALAFITGWTVLALALSGPLDYRAASSLAAHVAQHMLLMTVVPPLLLLGFPVAVLLGLLPSRMARALTQPMNRLRRAVPWQRYRGPISATLVQAVCMWSWHLPAAMDLALRHEAAHGLMHASFLVVGLWFWAALLRGVREPRFGAGMSAIAIVGSMMSMGLLGALLTFAEAPRYPAYVERARIAGLDALHDQQLAGLIMWVPSALPYLIGGVIIAALWMQRSEDRDDQAGPR